MTIFKSSESAKTNLQESNNGGSRSSLLWQEYKGLLLFLVLMTIFRSALADWNEVPTGSMQPTIVEGDRILVNKMAYDLRLPFTHKSLMKLADPERGDIIVFDSEVSDVRLVKRVAAVPGDVIQMRDNRLIINGKLLTYNGINNTNNESIYEDRSEDLLGIVHSVRVLRGYSRSANFAPIKIPDNYFLALGDNRDNSADSRVIGLVPRNEIVGRARSVVMSLNYDNHYIPRSDRFFKSL